MASKHTDLDEHKPVDAVEQLVKSPIWLVWEREVLSL